MACARCHSIRERIKRWFRDVTGVTEILANTGNKVAAYVSQELRDVKVAGSQLEENTAKELQEVVSWLQGLADKSRLHDAKIVTISKRFDGLKIEARILKDRINDQALALERVEEEIKNIEFPEPIALDYRIDDMKEG